MADTAAQLTALLDPAPRRRPDLRYSDMLDLCERVRCADGFHMSVQTGRTHYCTPRDNDGPWTHVEVGFPSARAEQLMPYCEDPNDPTETVYACVPVELVVAVIDEHGGFKAEAA